MRAVCVSAKFISLTKYLRGLFIHFLPFPPAPPLRFSPEELMEEGFAGVDLKFSGLQNRIIIISQIIL